MQFTTTTITKITGIELSVEEKEVIQNLADKCDQLCNSLHSCEGCLFEDFCDFAQTPCGAFASILRLAKDCENNQH